MTEPLVERARSGRQSGAVLKVSLSNIRSRDRSIPVFVFEGQGDFGPYRVWIGRIRDGLKYVPLNARGKRQVLEFRARLQADTGNLKQGVYFFVDHDFDGLQGHAPGPDLFCIDSYSIENYLVSAEVVRSILIEEFRCSAIEDECDKVVRIFDDVARQFLQCMRAANRRMFFGTRLGIRGSGVEEALSRYVEIGLTEVRLTCTDQDLQALIPLEREPAPEEIDLLAAEFDALDPRTGYRGKFIIGFLLRWLELLAEERRRSDKGVFSTTFDVKFSTQKLSMDSLAGRSEIPKGLRSFVTSIAA